MLVAARDPAAPGLRRDLAGVRHARQRREHPAAVGLRAGARPGHGARRAGRRHRPLGRLGRARFGDAGRHRPCRRAAIPPSPCSMGVGIGAAVGLVNARAGRGPADQPGDRHARHDDRRARAQPRGARALQFLGGDQGADLHRSRPPDRARHPARRAGGDRRWPSCSGSCCAARYSAARCMRSAMRRSPRGSPACGSSGCARIGLCRLRRACRRRRRAGRGAHRPDQPLDRRRAGILRHRRRGARRRRPAGRTGQRRPDASSAR